MKQAQSRAATVWLTGLSGAGKTSIADALARRLQADGRAVTVLDGDLLRHGLNRDLGFTPQDRHENIRRTAEVARLMNDAGLIVIAALISPNRDDRAMAAAIIGDARFIEVHVSTPVQGMARMYAVRILDGRIYLDLKELNVPASKAEQALAGSFALLPHVQMA